MKKAVVFCLTLCALLLSSCGRGGEGLAPAESKTNDPAVTSAIPTQDEIRAMLASGKGGVYWAVDENDFARSESVTIYSASPFEGYLWDALFSKVQVVSQEKFDDAANMTVLIDGQESGPGRALCPTDGDGLLCPVVSALLPRSWPAPFKSGRYVLQLWRRDPLCAPLLRHSHPDLRDSLEPERDKEASSWVRSGGLPGTTSGGF